MNAREINIRVDKFITIVLELFIVFFLSVTALIESNISLKFLCAFSLVNTVFVLLVMAKLSNRLFSISSVFMLFLSVFHFGQAWLYLFDSNIDEKISYDIFKIYPHEQISHVLLFCLVSYNLIALFWMIFIRSTGKQNKPIQNELTKEEKTQKECLYSFGIYLFLILFIPVCVYDYLSVSLVVQYGHRGIYDFADKLAIWAAAESYFPLSIIMILISCDSENKTWKWVYYYAIIRAVVLMVLTGSRDSYIIPMLLFIYTKHNFVEKYRRKHIVWILLGIVLFLTLLSFISYGRGDYSNLNFFEFMKDHNIIVQIFSEFGSTLVTTILAYRYSLSYGFIGGKSFLGGLSIFFPMSNIFFSGVKKYISIATILNPYSPSGGALGGSLFGEMYMNFGYYSLLIAPIFGFIISKIDNIIDKTKKNLLSTSVAIYISYGFWIYVRGGLSDVVLTVKRAVYIIIIYWVFKHFFFKKSSDDKGKT